MDVPPPDGHGGDLAAPGHWRYVPLVPGRPVEGREDELLRDRLALPGAVDEIARVALVRLELRTLLRGRADELLA